MMTNCQICGLSYIKWKNKRHNKFCSKLCHSIKMSLLMTNREVSIETRKKISIFNTTLTGEKARRWIKDRSKLVKRQERNDVAYKDWRRQVWLRDSFKCKIANPNCEGRIEAHHILSWRYYPELRYQVNNGITLCRAHHPRVRAEEKRLIPTFQELVSVSR